MNDFSQYSENSRLIALVHLAGLESRIFDSLFRRYGVSENIYASVSEIADDDDFPEEIAFLVDQASSRLEEAADIENMLSHREIQITNRFEEKYPSQLFELNDPPPLLFIRGTLPDPKRKIVAIAGTEGPSNEGLEKTTKLVRELTKRGVQVISSLAGGIDAAVHLGAKSSQSNSFGVLDGGLDKIDIQETMPVAIDVVSQGGIISEFLPEKEADESSFGLSNRLIAGLGQAVVLTEFYENSVRALDIATCCNDIGKLLFVLVDPDSGALSDEKALAQVMHEGAIPIEGADRFDNIIKSLV